MSSDSEGQRDAAPGNDLGVELQVKSLALALLHPSLSSGFGVVSVGAEGTFAGPELLPSGLSRGPLASNTGPSLLLRPGGREVPLGHGDFLCGLEEFRGLPLEDRLKMWETTFSA